MSSKRLLLPLVCAFCPAAQAAVFGLSYSYTLGAGGNVLATNTVPQTTPVLFSQTLIGPGAQSFVRGVGNYGVLQLIGTSDATSAPTVENGASAYATEAFSDALVFSSATLPAGSLVSFQLTATLHDLFAYTPSDPLIASNSCASQDQDSVVFFSLAGQLGDSACLRSGTQTVSRTFNTTVGSTVPLNSSLAINGRADTYQVFGGVPYSSPVDDVSLDASNTAVLTVNVLTPGVNFTAASGASYTPASSAVPEPRTVALAGAGLLAAVLARFARR